jgi:hypothetical protein
MTRLEGYIDHFDKDFAIIARADRSTTNVARKELPSEARVGDFIVEANTPCHFMIDRKTTKLRRREMRYLYGVLFD